MLGSSNKFKRATANRRARPKLAFDYDEDEEEVASSEEPRGGVSSSNAPTSTGQADSSSGNTAATSKSASRPRKYAHTIESDDEDYSSVKVKAARSVLNKQGRVSTGLATSLLNSKIRSKLLPQLPTQGFADSSTNVYSKSYLDELRESTPTTPAEYTNGAGESEPVDVPMIDEDERYRIDTAADVKDSSMEIPDSALIDHLIEKRHQKAIDADESHEDEFIALDEDMSDAESLPKAGGTSGHGWPNKPESGFVLRDDDLVANEDDFIAEGADGKVPLSAAEAVQQKSQRRREIEELINEREDEEKEMGNEYFVNIDESDSDSGWEQAQLQKGAFGSKAFSNLMAETDNISKPEAGPKTKSSYMILQELPDLDSVVARLKVTLESMRVHNEANARTLEELKSQKEEIEAREREVKQALEAAPF